MAFSHRIAFGTFVGQRNLANGVTDTDTGPQYVEGADYVAFNSITGETLYIIAQGMAETTPMCASTCLCTWRGLRYHLKASTHSAGAMTTCLTVRFPVSQTRMQYPRPAHQLWGAAIRRTTDGSISSIESSYGVDRVLNFESYPLTADGFRFGQCL